MCVCSILPEKNDEKIYICVSALILSMYNIVNFQLLQGMPKNIVIGSHVWVGDPELVWIDG